MAETGGENLLASQPSEMERLRTQSLVWEPAACKLLDRLGDGAGLRVLDVGCGGLGWLRVLAEWVGDSGEVVGTDTDPHMLESARGYLAEQGIVNVTLEHDDLFESSVPAASFDLVHARFEIAPIGRGDEQVAAHRKLLKPGGWLVLEEPDTTTWIYHPSSEAIDELIDLIEAAFADGGGDLNAGLQLGKLLEAAGLQPEISREVVELEAGHSYQRLPLQFATSLRERLIDHVSEAELEELVAQVDTDLANPDCTSITFTLVQAVARV